jgi:hypothetical protein
VQFRGVKTFHFVQFEGEKLSILCSLSKKVISKVGTLGSSVRKKNNNKHTHKVGTRHAVSANPQKHKA